MTGWCNHLTTSRATLTGQLRLVELLLRDAHSGLVVDVGAHLGFATLYAASLGHRVIGLEPQSELYHMALASRDANPRISNRVQLFRAAAHWDTGRMHTLSFEFAERRGGQRTSGTCGPVGTQLGTPQLAVTHLSTSWCRPRHSGTCRFGNALPDGSCSSCPGGRSCWA